MHLLTLEPNAIVDLQCKHSCKMQSIAFYIGLSLLIYLGLIVLILRFFQFAKDGAVQRKRLRDNVNQRKTSP